MTEPSTPWSSQARTPRLLGQAAAGPTRQFLAEPTTQQLLSHSSAQQKVAEQTTRSEPRPHRRLVSEQIRDKARRVVSDLREVDLPPLFRVGIVLTTGIVLAVLIVSVHSLFASGPPRTSPPSARGATTSTASEASVGSSTNPAGNKGTGFAVGRVLSNKNEILQLGGMFGGSVTIRTDKRTRVLILLGTRVSDIQTGGTIAVYGDRQADGAIVARLIVGVSPRGPAE
ncbi:hypothetical protein BJY24_007640 [Nocardia transvalensis]|uniref:DUF5666 domain-containing protein n=1 Tax=Nocardia transvalensis TaxID=37333 RepID=A0A7W9PNE4_9NOCA|nr:hypothetical protein [Nocardia transvalensis]MBB5918728.1 hypothetical protein [Nocardia transvalensis]